MAADSTERVLLVMRHAHAEPATGSPDHARRLTDAGRDEAARIGRQLAPRHVPDVALTSSAVRAVRTAEEVIAGSESRAEVHSTEELYLASGDGLLDAVHGLNPDARTALLVGHQPILQEFALALADEESDPSYIAAISEHFRPATVALFRYDGLWGEMEFGEAELFDVLTA
ncbi:SixA phosphatase family protein [Spelaeicoccus albus]|uniref:Phosphohistidine phosphatase n=1 Tax=Spelaeicoccus albus TaxID=1280376 RepID=A0A7Z0D425_9MICO|nr:histidine phosphatase family protein [Spelaeicoccus albus]NYI68504.1 phosphohistidine phosphatase [Spelaeicoccus albus]